MQFPSFKQTGFFPQETFVQLIRSSSFFGFVPRVREQSPKVPVSFSGIATIATLSPVLSGKHPIRGIAKHPIRGIAKHPIRGIAKHPIRGIAKHPIRGITHPAAWVAGSKLSRASSIFRRQMVLKKPICVVIAMAGCSPSQKQSPDLARRSLQETMLPRTVEGTPVSQRYRTRNRDFFNTLIVSFFRSTRLRWYNYDSLLTKNMPYLI